MNVPVQRPFQQPKFPVFGWSNLGGGPLPATPGVQQLPHRQLTTSGRAALLGALLQLQLPAGSLVLLPSYHCPTMVAPVHCAGLSVRYYGLDANGLPDLDALDATQAGAGARAMVVAHLFGIPRSLAAIRAWCDRQGIALIEDCAHCLYGQAGERPVGAWGDFATASLTKFLPVPEAGLLASARRAFDAQPLHQRGFTEQIKGWVDVLELGTRYRRLPGLHALLGVLFRWKNRRRSPEVGTPHGGKPEDQAPDPRNPQLMMAGCDMQRSQHAPLAISHLLLRLLPQGRVLKRRQAAFRRYQQGLAGLNGARPLFGALPTPVAPYVFPLWVDEPEPVYAALRALDAPVFRWDRLWIDTPTDLPGDHGPAWSHHVLQLLCHQDLDASEIDRLIAILRDLTANGKGTA